MLSRVADSLFWLARYVERAENLARMTEVARRDALEDASSEGHDAIWKPVIHATCLGEELTKKQRKSLQEDPAYYVTLDPLNDKSIAACISLARENARGVRDQLSEEMWLELNTIHLYLKSAEAKLTYEESPEVLFRKIIRFSIIYQGLNQSTILHDIGWQFARLGKYLERADKTSRMLDTLTFGPTDLDTKAKGSFSVLRSCSGFTAFRSEYRNNDSLRNVASFLLFSHHFPRSVRFCFQRIEQTLLEISGTKQGAFSNEAERLTGETLALLNFSHLDEFMSPDLHWAIDRVQKKMNEIGQKLFEQYVKLPSEIQEVVRTEEVFRETLQQQQRSRLQI